MFANVAGKACMHKAFLVFCEAHAIIGEIVPRVEIKHLLIQESK